MARKFSSCTAAYSRPRRGCAWMLPENSRHIYIYSYIYIYLLTKPNCCFLLQCNEFFAFICRESNPGEQRAATAGGSSRPPPVCCCVSSVDVASFLLFAYLYFEFSSSYHCLKMTPLQGNLCPPPRTATVTMPFTCGVAAAS